MNLLIISGSPRQGSLTHRVALFLQNHLKSKTTHQVSLISLQQWNLPALQNVWGSIDKVPAAYQPMATLMFEANAIILVSPEYNGSYAPAMKNLIDHFPKQHHKAFGIVTASPGGMGGIRASQQLQLLVGGLLGILSPYMLITPSVDKKFDENGNLIDPAFLATIDQFVYEFVWLAENVFSK